MYLLDSIIPNRYLKTYTDPTQFGCTDDSTLQEFFENQPNGSLFVYNSNSLNHESWAFPYAGGNDYFSTVCVLKISQSRWFALSFTKLYSIIYHMGLKTENSVDMPSGVWYQFTMTEINTTSLDTASEAETESEAVRSKDIDGGTI